MDNEQEHAPTAITWQQIFESMENSKSERIAKIKERETRFLRLIMHAGKMAQRECNKGNVCMTVMHDARQNRLAMQYWDERMRNQIYM